MDCTKFNFKYTRDNKKLDWTLVCQNEITATVEELNEEELKGEEKEELNDEFLKRFNLTFTVFCFFFLKISARIMDMRLLGIIKFW